MHIPNPSAEFNAREQDFKYLVSCQNFSPELANYCLDNPELLYPRPRWDFRWWGKHVEPFKVRPRVKAEPSEREPGDRSPGLTPRTITNAEFGGPGQRLSRSAIHARALRERKKQTHRRTTINLVGWRAA